MPRDRRRAARRRPRSARARPAARPRRPRHGTSPQRVPSGFPIIGLLLLAPVAVGVAARQLRAAGDPRPARPARNGMPSAGVCVLIERRCVCAARRSSTSSSGLNSASDPRRHRHHRQRAVAVGPEQAVHDRLRPGGAALGRRADVDVAGAGIEARPAAVVRDRRAVRLQRQDVDGPGGDSSPARGSPCDRAERCCDRQARSSAGRARRPIGRNRGEGLGPRDPEVWSPRPVGDAPWSANRFSHPGIEAMRGAWHFFA
jgi:hypothetical protein